MTDQHSNPLACPADFGKLSPTVAMAIGNMSADQRDVFDYEYRRAKRSTVVMVLLAYCSPSSSSFSTRPGWASSTG